MNPVEASRGPGPVGPQRATEFSDLVDDILFTLCGKYLKWDDLKVLRNVNKRMRNFIEQNHGIDVYVPARLKHPPEITGLSKERMNPAIVVPEEVVWKRIEEMDGRVVRTLELVEDHPDLRPHFPANELIQAPRRLLRLALTYVDIRSVLALLERCPNLREFWYRTGSQRILPEGIRPVPVPLSNDGMIVFMSQLERPTLRLQRLTVLKLCMKKPEPNNNSDWANVFTLLLLLADEGLPNLTHLTFDLSVRGITNLKDYLQLDACVATLVANTPRVEVLKWMSAAFHVDWDEGNMRWNNRNWIDVDHGDPLPQNVITSLIQKYGSPGLKELVSEKTFGSRERMITACRRIMGEAGAALSRLREIRMMTLFQYQSELLLGLLNRSPSVLVQSVTLVEQSAKSFGESPIAQIFSQVDPSGEPQPSWTRTVRRLAIRRQHELFNNVRENETVSTVSLTELLGKMETLESLDVTPRTRYLGGGRRNLPEHDGNFRMLEQERDDWATPDLSIEQPPEGRDVFGQLKSLVMNGVKMELASSSRLALLRNLEQLDISFLPEDREIIYGITAGDLIKLVCSMRKLDQLEINMVCFPDDDYEPDRDNDEGGEEVEEAQKTFLRAIGSFTPMNMLVRQPLGVRQMEQYEFSFEGLIEEL